jgi:hypothetical protein
MPPERGIVTVQQTMPSPTKIIATAAMIVPTMRLPPR